MGEMKLLLNGQRKACGKGASLTDFEPDKAGSVREYHRKFREYAPTPLLPLPNLAKSLGLGNIFVKDESKRFGLNAFKVLGGSYAIGRIVADRLGLPFDNLDVEKLRAGGFDREIGDIAFATATDGNHGRGVAWTARQFRRKAHVFMPKGSAQIRAQNIRSAGAECVITDFNYDDAVRFANREAEKNGWIMVQDTAWDGYEDIPRWIMQGYITLAAEALDQLRDFGVEVPSHLFLQAGVGSFAGAALGFFAAALGNKLPRTVIVEPDKADCVFRSLSAADGKAHNVTGDLATIMAGLACGEPSTISWGVLRDYAAAGISCADFLAANGMRILAAPLPGDPAITSGESGAVSCGVLERICSVPWLDVVRAALDLTPDSTVLLVSTEGDTSPDMYRDIVWRGRYPATERES
ncbi:MAG: diaminopropionate ammonia-lyase [Planctomycetota bacterium]|jgi:diaminopropionate ammonia-lyase|nr:diaminopropionate ammonia-lyase [Planctomycetota bacterium]